MYPCTNAFYNYPNNQKVADKYKIVIGSSHTEQMLRNDVAEWDHKKYGEYSYVTNKETIQNYWDQRVEETSEYENIYTLGMGGIHDSGMEGIGSSDKKSGFAGNNNSGPAKYVKTT